MSALFVSRLPRYDFDERDLEDLFDKFGKITECNMKHGARFGYGFVYFDHPDDAKIAIRETDGINIDGVRIVVEKARERRLPKCYDCGESGHKSIDCRR
ncbi:hypothetical protein BD770DRAFT_382578 [Pilaira anomala]|nr:hypothetical protein BD770DRAFT_382578 [Pilaira anomala]